MVHLSWNGKSEIDLLGMFIFHASKGGIPLIGFPPYGNFNIGSHLGKVVEVAGPNRIYYLDDSNTKKYVSLAGIGIVCSNLDEVEKINNIRERGFIDFKKSVAVLSSGIEYSIKNLL